LTQMLQQGVQLSVEGIREILEIRRDMNDGGKRRYTDEAILSRIGNPQRLYARPSRNTEIG